MPGTPPDPGTLAPGGAPAVPVVTPTPPGTPPGTPPAADPPEETVKLTSAQLNERLERTRQAERTKLLKSMGFDSEEQAKQVREDAEKRRQASLTREQQLEEENKRLTAERDSATAARAAAEFDRELAIQCSTHKITDVEYARYLVQSGKVAQEGIGAFLAEQSKDDRKKVALGISEVPATTVPTPLHTSPTSNRQLPPAPPANGAVGEKDVFKMSPSEFEAHVRTHHS